ncbi:DUF2914 domain-containing protein [Lacinutrix neustonica]|uniref:DUF2914 domain-containing protein n=1 Tax=Lacinutrix neustonica TaxID=2980107 RepID=A0A9E8MVX2_9FLAO|nr:DUF2914 domain-containing protein [Lacinutrix neustonica]WAC02563.1 DUF2914 domain-containing protein [Lacinutrix neustonica]
MNKTVDQTKQSKPRNFLSRHKKYMPILFFIAGFIFDTLTLGRIDRLYDMVVLCLHMTALTASLYLYNLVDDGAWENTILGRFEAYLPLAIQFFFGGLSSAYVIYFSRSVSLSKTLAFFIILVALLVANEFLKKRISNKYLQFSIYFFISFTFFAFMVPVLIKEMSTAIFLFSGVISFICTLLLIISIYYISPSTRIEIHLGKLIGIIFAIYISINTFYLFNLIPPVPLAMDTGLVAHNIEMNGNNYVVTYEKDEWYIFWRSHRLQFVHHPDENVYVFSSIFAPTDLSKKIYHRWNWYNPKSKQWDIVEDIGYNITGGRDGGFRGYTFKSNIKSGSWKVEVITEEELVLGVIDFELIANASSGPRKLVQKEF